MRSIEQIVVDNGNDNTPAMDTHNLTGRVTCTYCELPTFRLGCCAGHFELITYNPDREIAANE